MSTILTAPGYVPANTGTVTGTSAVAALADSSDTTFVTFTPGQGITVNFLDPVIPTGGIVKSIGLVVRAYAPAGGGPQLESLVNALNSSGADIYDTAVNTLTNAVPMEWTSVTLTSDNADATAFTAGLNVSTSTAVLTKVTQKTTYVAKPTVAITAIPTLTTTNHPTIEWTPTLDSDGGTQFAYSVKVFTDAQYGAGGFNPDTSTPYWEKSVVGAGGGAVSAAVDVALPNDNYRAYVKVSQLVSWVTAISSAWATEDFTVNVPSPGDPTLNTTADNADGKVMIALADTGATATTLFEVQRLTADGYVDVRTELGDGAVLAPDPTIWDFEMPAGALTYRARAVHFLSLANYTYSGWTTDTVTYAPTSLWLKHPTTPTLNKAVTLRSFPGHTRASRQSVEQPLGRSDAVVISDARGPETGEITFRLSTDNDRDAIMALADAGVPLLLQPLSTDHERDRWIILGDEQIVRLIDSAWSTERNGIYSWTEVVRPESGVIVAWPAA